MTGIELQNMSPPRRTPGRCEPRPRRLAPATAVVHGAQATYGGISEAILRMNGERSEGTSEGSPPMCSGILAYTLLLMHQK
jgi:hypothetical protein